MDQWSEGEFAAYLAAFTDGEGHIEAPGHGGLRIVLSNTYLPVLEAMQARLGFGVIRSQQRAKPHHRDRYVLVFSNAADCEAVARLIEPYVVIKRRAVEALLRQCDEWREVIATAEARNQLIREALAAGEVQKDIASRFGVSQQTVSRLKLGHTWPSEQRSARRAGRAASLQGRVKRHWSSDPARLPRDDVQSTPSQG